MDMRYVLASAMVLLAACGGGTDGGITNPPPPKKPDPYIAVRVRDLLDTTTAPGRAHWHLYALLSGPDVNQNGISNQGAISLQDVRLNRPDACIKVGADSVGQRLISPIAIADTTTSELTADATADGIITAWYGGNHNMPAGWMALFIAPTDAWISEQYNAGHGLTRNDPIKWSFDWTASGTTSFYERSDADPACATF